MRGGEGKRRESEKATHGVRKSGEMEGGRERGSREGERAEAVGLLGAVSVVHTGASIL